MDTEQPRFLFVEGFNSREPPAEEVCPSCSSISSETRQNRSIFILEVFEDATTDARWHTFGLYGESAEKHAYIFEGQAVGKRPRYRAILLENPLKPLPIGSRAARVGIHPEVFEIHTWARTLRSVSNVAV